MRFRAWMAGGCLAAVMAGGLAAQHAGGHAQPYAGLDSRAIKSLSSDDLAELRAGRGWGLALPAELNGRPGPAHVLELADELGLSAAELAEVRQLHAAMTADAKAAAAEFIAAEAALERAFAQGDMDADSLRGLVGAAAEARGRLRYTHLVRHLETARILTPQQIAAYNRLRGYGEDPCETVPEGHDPEMWRAHNGCG